MMTTQRWINSLQSFRWLPVSTEKIDTQPERRQPAAVLLFTSLIIINLFLFDFFLDQILFVSITGRLELIELISYKASNATLPIFHIEFHFLDFFR